MELQQQIRTYDHVVLCILLGVIYVKVPRHAFLHIQLWWYKVYIGGICFQKVNTLGAQFNRLGIFLHIVLYVFLTLLKNSPQNPVEF